MQKINYINKKELKRLVALGMTLIITGVPFLSKADTYTVKKGDTLKKIALEFYGNSYYSKELSYFNNLNNPNLIRVGQVLEIPELKILLIDDNKTEINSRYNHVVLKGETLGSISMKYYGTSDYNYIKVLAVLNDYENINLIYTGDNIFIPSPKNMLKYLNLLNNLDDNDTLSNYYFVEKGDTLSKISYWKYQTNDYVDFIADINALNNKNLIKVGQLLYVPGMYKNKTYRK